MDIVVSLSVADSLKNFIKENRFVLFIYYLSVSISSIFFLSILLGM